MKKYIFMLSVSLLLLAACSKDDDALVRQDGKEAIQFVRKSFSASCKDDKTAFVPGTKLEQGFQKGDQVFVFGARVEPLYSGRIGTIDTLNSTAWGGGKPYYRSIKFDVEVPVGETTFHALMPYQQSMYVNEISVQTSQTAEAGSNDPSTNFLYATSNNNVFNFQHACAYIRLRVKNNSNSANKFVINSDRPVSGICKYDFSNGFELKSRFDKNIENFRVRLSKKGGGKFEDTAYIATVIPTSENSIVVYEVWNSSDKLVASCAVQNRKFEAGKIYTVTLDGDKLTATGEPSDVQRTDFFYFSEENTRKRYIFSKGNLQYNASTDTWRFAENQWDVIGSLSQYGERNNYFAGNVSGSDNANVGKEDYKGWIDFFSLTDDVTNNAASYLSCKKSSGARLITNSKLIEDLGDGWLILGSNRISPRQIGNFGSMPYDYFGFAKVDNVNGVVLISSEWGQKKNGAYQTPYGEFKFTEGGANGWATNIYTIDEWKVGEAAGAVFLPAAGELINGEIHDVGSVLCWILGYENSDDDKQVVRKFYNKGESTGFVIESAASVRLIR